MKPQNTGKFSKNEKKYQNSITFKVDQIPEKEDFGIAKALASILKLIETVIMDTAFAEGPPNGRLPSTSDDADILENGNMETKIGSQESFTENNSRLYLHLMSTKVVKISAKYLRLRLRIFV
jgi:hypothetical protein